MTKSRRRDITADALDLSDQVKPILSGHNPNVVGGALADLVALYVAGHRTGSADKALRAKMQEDVLGAWLELVERLIPGQNAMIDAHLATGEPFVYTVIDGDDLKKPRSQH
jgi:hypothetical protein